MTWLGIIAFIVVCTVPMAAYIYLIEVRTTPDPGPPSTDPADRRSDAP